MKHLMLLFTISLFTNMAVSYSSWRFDIPEGYHGEFLEYPKDKHGVKELGEDSVSATPWSLIVCDGVGGYDFTTKFFSNLLVNGFQLETIDILLNQPENAMNSQILMEYINKQLKEHLLAYENFQISFLKKWSKSVGVAFKKEHYEYFGSGSTLVAAVLTEYQEKPYIKVMQKGDSLIRVYRRDKNTLFNEHFLIPVFATKEFQQSFNFPYQYSTTSYSDYNKLHLREFEAELNDIVIVGSDGFFDNVPDGLVWFLLNYLLKYGIESKRDLIAKITIITEAYAEVLVQKTQIIKKTILKKNTFTKDDELFLGKNEKEKNEWRSKSKLAPFVEHLNNYFDVKFGSNSPFKDEKEKSIIRKFLECPVFDLISIDNDDWKKEINTGKCLMNIVDSDLYVTLESFEDFIANFGTQQMSQVFGIVAKILSENPVLPCPFMFHAWKSRQFLFDEDTMGKPDDISVIVTSIIKNQIQEKEIKAYKGEFLESSKGLIQDLGLNLNAYTSYIYKKENKEPITVEYKLPKADKVLVTIQPKEVAKPVKIPEPELDLEVIQLPPKGIVKLDLTGTKTEDFVEGEEKGEMMGHEWPVRHQTRLNGWSPNMLKEAAAKIQKDFGLPKKSQQMLI